MSQFTKIEKGSSFMQCGCMMQGFGIESEFSPTFRKRTFRITDKDRAERTHTCRFEWNEDRSKFESFCDGE